MIKVISAYNLIFILLTDGHICCGISISQNEKSLVFFEDISYFYLLALESNSFYSYSCTYFFIIGKLYYMMFIT